MLRQCKPSGCEKTSHTNNLAFKLLLKFHVNTLYLITEHSFLSSQFAIQILHRSKSR